MNEFTWTVDLDGYEALQLRETDSAEGMGAWLIIEKGQPAVHRTRSYAPLIECAGFHRTFAATEPVVAAVIAFTNRYGFLGEPVTRIVRPPYGPRLGREIKGEFVSDWYAECQALRKAIQLWDAICSTDPKILATVIQGNRISSGEQRAELSSKPADSVSGLDIRPAASCLQKLINERMAAHRIEARVVWDLDQALLKNALVPASLLGALWADFAQAVGENRGPDAYLKCTTCGTFFEKGRSKRRDARYCSDACKSRAYRRRSAVDHG